MQHCLLSLVSQAATIVGYDFTTGTSASFADSNVTVSAFNLNSGSTGFDLNSAVGDSTGETAGIDFSTEAGNFRAVNTDLKNGNYAAAFSAGDYVSFTIEANSGFELNLDSIIWSSSIASNASRAATDYVLVSSVDGYASTLTSGTVTTVAGGVSEYQQFSVDLSSNAAYQGLTDEVEFRLYVWGGADGLSNSAINYDNFGVTGDLSAVPEPSSFALLAGCFTLASVMLRRRRA